MTTTNTIITPTRKDDILDRCKWAVSATCVNTTSDIPARILTSKVNHKPEKMARAAQEGKPFYTCHTYIPLDNTCNTCYAVFIPRSGKEWRIGHDDDSRRINTTARE